MRPFNLCLCLFVVFLHLQSFCLCQPRKSAILLTDVKLDDCLAFHVLAARRQYDTMVAVLTGLEDQKTAQQVLEGFWQEMLERDPRLKNTKLRILRGSVFQKAPHELTWEYIPNLPAQRDDVPFSSEALNYFLASHDVEIFQIAPTSKEDLQVILDIEHPYGISLFQVTHGYNTRFWENGIQLHHQEQSAYVRSIEGRLASIQNGKPGLVLATDKGRDTWLARDGSTYSANKLKLFYPAPYVDAAFWDPFPSRQLQSVAELLTGDKVRGRELALSWNQDLLRNMPEELKSRVRVSHGSADPILEVIQFSRAHPDSEAGVYIRNYWIDLIEHGTGQQASLLSFLKSSSQSSTIANKKGLLLGRFTDGVLPLLKSDNMEIYDAKHVLLGIRAADNAHAMLVRFKMTHPRGDPNRWAEIKEAPPGDQGEGYKVVPRPQGEADELFEGVMHGIAGVADAASSAGHSIHPWRKRSLGRHAKTHNTV